VSKSKEYHKDKHAKRKYTFKTRKVKKRSVLSPKRGQKRDMLFKEFDE